LQDKFYAAGLAKATSVQFIGGGFKRSSQHHDEGGVDGDTRAAFGSVWTGPIDFTRSAASGGAI
jgi:hypothetical protein